MNGRDESYLQTVHKTKIFLDNNHLLGARFNARPCQTTWSGSNFEHKSYIVFC